MAEVTNLATGIAITPKHEEGEDPKIVRIAKLALILGSKDVEALDKLGCIKIAMRQGIITEEEAVQLFAHRDDLEGFMDDPEG